MTSYEKFFHNHSADLTQVGFDYQFYCFLLSIFSVDQLDLVTYEGEDDIEIQTENGKVHLIQVKHSTNAPKEKLNDLDADLWKTITNWIKQSEAYKTCQSAQDSFFDRYTFTLVTNKEIKCMFVSMLSEYMQHNTTEEEIRTYLNEQRAKASKLTRDYIEKLLSLNDKDFKKFLNNFHVKYIPNILECLYNHFRRMFSTDKQTDDTLFKLIGYIHNEKYKGALKKTKLAYTRRQFEKEHITILQGENPDLPQMLSDFEENPTIPKNFANMNLFKQLDLIGIVDLKNENDDEIPINYARYLHYINNINRFYSESLIDKTYTYQLENYAKSIWDNVFLKEKRDLKKLKKENPDTDHTKPTIDAGYNCFTTTMSKTIKSYEIHFSNGCFLKLSNDNPPKIGWHPEWENLIK